MNIWNTPQDIDAMSNSEWLSYRDNLMDEFYSRGHVLKPMIGCDNCKPFEDYVCFSCECIQLNKAREI
jgi:hypothetical protein